MKILVLNKEEEKVLTKMLSDSIINGTCHNYYLTTILEKISSGTYKAAFSKINSNIYKEKDIDF